MKLFFTENSRDLRIEITSTIFKNTDKREAILDDCRLAASECGITFGVQLHNSVTQKEIEWLLRQDVRLSAHAPVGQQLNWNFAAADTSKLLDAVAENVKFFRNNGISDAVFHGFFMTDMPVEAFSPGKGYLDCMQEIHRPELDRWQGNYRNADFTGSEEFRMRLRRVKDNMRLILGEFPDIDFRIENDYPCFGQGAMLAKDMLELDFPICLDTSHLWAACRIFGLDFLKECRKMTAGQKVTMMHLHASPYTLDIPAPECKDGHLQLSSTRWEHMSLDRVVRNACRHGLRHIVLETGNAENGDDIRLVCSFLKRR